MSFRNAHVSIELAAGVTSVILAHPPWQNLGMCTLHWNNFGII